MTYKCLLFELKDGVATLTLNRPERLNALGDTLRDDLHDAILKCSDNPEVRVIVITGAGKGFCSGGDVKAMNEAKEGRRERPLGREDRAQSRPDAAGHAGCAAADHRRHQRRGGRRRDEPGAGLRHPHRLDGGEVLAGLRASAACTRTGAAPTSCPASSAWPRPPSSSSPAS